MAACFGSSDPSRPWDTSVFRGTYHHKDCNVLLPRNPILESCHLLQHSFFLDTRLNNGEGAFRNVFLVFDQRVSKKLPCSFYVCRWAPESRKNMIVKEFSRSFRKSPISKMLVAPVGREQRARIAPFRRRREIPLFSQ